MEIEYSWSSFLFDLHDVKFNSCVELQEKDDDYWIPRDPMHLILLSDEDEAQKAGIEAWENNPIIRYSSSTRHLSAKAKMSDILSPYGCIYLGVPEDKGDVAGREGRIEEIGFQISELDGDDLSDTIKHSRMHYFEESDRESESGFLSLYVPSDVMDSIEKSINSDAREFQASVNIKCWNFYGPLDDSYLYIDKEHSEHAELASFRASKAFSDENLDYIYDDPNNKYERGEVISPDVNVNIYKKLSKIEGHLKDFGRVVVIAIFVSLIAFIANKYLS